jgi:aminocarboxymuconate-semialdehyde decarboxylase
VSRTLANVQLRAVDVHAHLLVAAVEDAVAGHPGLAAQRELDAARAGAASVEVSREMFRAVLPQLTDLDTRLADMHRAAVAVQVVSPSPTQYHQWADARLSRTVWRLANEGVAEFCSRAPEQLVGLGLAPLQHPAAAVDALDHAVSDCGLVGVEISSHADRGAGERRLELSAPELESFWARAEELGAVVFLHPLGCTLDARLDRWYLSNVVGQPVEHAVALSHLIFGGVLDRHPGLRIVAAHGGGYLPHYLGRSDHAWLERDDCRGCAELPSSYLRRLWFDSLVHDPGVLQSLVSAVGADRVLMGSDYPFDMGVPDPVVRLRVLDDDVVTEIARTNPVELGLVPAGRGRG